MSMLTYMEDHVLDIILHRLLLWNHCVSSVWETQARRSLRNQKTLLFHWLFKVLEWVGARGRRNKKIVSATGGYGLREPKLKLLFFLCFFQCVRGMGVLVESWDPSSRI